MSSNSIFINISDCRILTKNRNIINNPIKFYDFYLFIISYGEDVFPNLQIALHLLLSIGCSIASCERSFIKLKLIKTYMRSTLSQERLYGLAILSIERKIFNNINIEEIVEEFTIRKNRKITL